MFRDQTAPSSVKEHSRCFVSTDETTCEEDEFGHFYFLSFMLEAASPSPCIYCRKRAKG